MKNDPNLQRQRRLVRYLRTSSEYEDESCSSFQVPISDNLFRVSNRLSLIDLQGHGGTSSCYLGSIAKAEVV